MKNFYNNISDNDKMNFIENIKIIISPKIKYESEEDFELPYF